VLFAAASAWCAWSTSPGELLSSAGLGAVIYGFINAGQHGWGSLVTWVTTLAGLALLAGFVIWERHTSHPLIELSLFGNGQFSWGTVHATIANFALFGLLFALPQFFQSVAGASPLGTGYGFAAAWIAVLGLGIGMALPAAMTGALGALSAERAGAGSGLLQALRQVGGTIGVAILGTVLSAGYRDRLHPGHLPPALNRAAHDSVAAGIQVATTRHDRVLAQAVKVAFVHGMDLALIVSGGLALAGAVLALLFLPRRPRPAGPAGPAKSPAADVQPDAEQSVR
jgi:hypothetical protein